MRSFSSADLYEADVGNIHEHYREIFYQYHIQFTKQAAAYLEKGIKIDRSRRQKDSFGSQTGHSPDLFNNVETGQGQLRLIILT